MFANRPLIPMLPAADLDRARTFYAEKRGLKPVEETADRGLVYEAGGASFAVYPSEFAGTNKATAAAWDVEDLDATVGSLKSRGVEFEDVELEGMEKEGPIVKTPDGSRAAWFSDSEGNIIAVAEFAR